MLSQQLFSQLLIQSTLHDYSCNLRDALLDISMKFWCIVLPDATLLDRVLYLMRYPYDPGILPSSAV